MVTVLIAFITFVLGCILTYYIERSGTKQSPASNLELREQTIKYKQNMEKMQEALKSLLEITIRTAADTALKMGQGAVGVSQTQNIYDLSYEEVKRQWDEKTKAERRADGKEKESSESDPGMALPHELDIKPGSMTKGTGAGTAAGIDNVVQEVESSAAAQSLDEIDLPNEQRPDAPKQAPQIPQNQQEDSEAPSSSNDDDLEDLEDLEKL
jgi:hypothetical protein